MVFLNSFSLMCFFHVSSYPLKFTTTYTQNKVGVSFLLDSDINAFEKLGEHGVYYYFIVKSVRNFGYSCKPSQLSLEVVRLTLFFPRLHYHLSSWLKESHHLSKAGLLDLHFFETRDRMGNKQVELVVVYFQMLEGVVNRLADPVFFTTS